MDCFALLDVEHRPWLDPEELKEKFHALTASHHPDVNRAGEVEFASINAAYQTLRDPVRRLRHLLELEFPEKLSLPQHAPAHLFDVFTLMAKYRQAVDDFFARQAKAKTQLDHALLAAEKLRHAASAEELLAELDQKQESLLVQLKSIDARWSGNKSNSAQPLPDIYQGISYLAKWSSQLREDVEKLAG